MAFLGNAPVNFGDIAEYEYEYDFENEQHEYDEDDEDTFQPPRRKLGTTKPNDCDDVRPIANQMMQLPNAHRCSS